MKLKDVKDGIREMYQSDPEVDSIRSLQRSFEEAQEGLTERDVPSEEQIRWACEALVEEGVLQRAGREGFEATEWFKEENS